MNVHERAIIDTSRSGTRRLGRVTLVLWVVKLIVFALFVNKVRQTSDWALQYSPQTQAGVGQWVLSMIVIVVFALICTVTWLSSRKRLRVQLERYLAGLRTDLAAARERGDAAAQVEAESELRRLEPYRGTAIAPVPIMPANPTTALRQAPAEDRYHRLAKLKKLLDDGVLSQVEFERERERILAET
jgi:hypothetical protein